MENAYNVTPLLNDGKDGTGRTIVIVDAFGSPTMASDLRTLMPSWAFSDPNFSVITPAGSPPPFDVNDDNQVGWSVETTLDVEWAHAIARGQHRARRRAESNDDTDIFTCRSTSSTTTSVTSSRRASARPRVHGS